jgi:hypothetical protein
VGVGRRGKPLRCTCGTVMRSRGVKTKTIVSLVGPLAFSRSAYHCPACGRWRYPGDEILDVINTRYSPGVRRIVAEYANDVPFKRVAHFMRSATGLSISSKDCERIAEGVGKEMGIWVDEEHARIRRAEPPSVDAPKTIETLYIEFDGTGVPMTPREVAGRKGKQKDGSAKTREVKLGCVFTQTSTDEEGRPVRDPGSTTFTGAIESAEVFGWRIYAEAVRRGLFEARRVICLGDGAQWVKNIAQMHFPNAQFIIDFYHAKEHVTELGKALFARPARAEQFTQRGWELLAKANIEELIEHARYGLPKDMRYGKDARREIAYFEKNKDYMRYAAYREQGLFIGSGVVEAGCKAVIGQRLKQSGMEWSVKGANAIIALRCVIRSNRFDDYWEQRAA